MRAKVRRARRDLEVLRVLEGPLVVAKGQRPVAPRERAVAQPLLDLDPRVVEAVGAFPGVEVPRRQHALGLVEVAAARGVEQQVDIAGDEVVAPVDGRAVAVEQGAPLGAGDAEALGDLVALEQDAGVRRVEREGTVVGGEGALVVAVELRLGVADVAPGEGQALVQADRLLPLAQALLFWPRP